MQDRPGTVFRLGFAVGYEVIDYWRKVEAVGLRKFVKDYWETSYSSGEDYMICRDHAASHQRTSFQNDGHADGLEVDGVH